MSKPVIWIEGYGVHGRFKDDPGALALFDEIEQEHDRHWIGNDIR